MSARLRFRNMARRAFDKNGLRTLGGILATLDVRGGESGIERIFNREGLWVHQYKEGFIVDRSINSKQSIVSLEDATQDFWEYLYQPSPGDVIVDVGAGIGSEISLFSKQVGPSGLVIAIEAHPETYRCLKLFCELNHLRNVRVYNYAITDKPGTVTIDDDQQHISSSILTEGGKIEVMATSLDVLLPEIGAERVNFLKMNIEGAERFAIKGMVSSIDRMDCVCISCHDFKSDRGEGEFFRTRGEVKSFLERNAFEITSRSDDSKPWVRDQVNAARKANKVGGSLA